MDGCLGFQLGLVAFWNSDLFVCIKITGDCRQRHLSVELHVIWFLQIGIYIPKFACRDSVFLIAQFSCALNVIACYSQ
jgi:hypothetical protein